MVERLEKEQQQRHDEDEDAATTTETKNSSNHRNCMSYKIISVMVCVVTMGVVSLSSSSQISLRNRSLAIIHHAETGTAIVDEDVHTIEEAHRERELNNAGLRYAVFGSSTSYGASLENEPGGRFNAYPYLLSDTVDNYADYSGGPNYPSVCTETMVGLTKMYDVIIFQFYLAGHDGLEQLARRIRQRYPNAKLIFLKIWAPYMMRRYNTNVPIKGWEGFQEWMERMDLPKDREVVRQALRDDTAEWFFPIEHLADGALRRSIDSVNGTLWDMTREPGDDMRGTLIKFLGLFDHNFLHLSKNGHTHVYENLRMLINTLVPSEVDQINDAVFGLPDDHWGDGDSCHFWFTNGYCNLDYDHSKLHVVNYNVVHGKYALQVFEEDNEGNPTNTHADITTHFNITNPFDTSRTLYLSFLGTKHNPSGTLPEYPRTKFHMNNNGGSGDGTNTHANTHFTIRPVAQEDILGIHIPITEAVAVIPALSTTTIWLTTLEESINPFSIVGVSLTDEQALPNRLTFAPPYNS